MKTLIFKITVAVGASLMVSSIAAAKETTEVAQEVRSLHLTADPTGGEILPKVPNLQFARGLFLPNKINGNGIPAGPVEPGDLRTRRASIQAVLQKALTDSMQLPLGQQIAFFAGTVKKVNLVQNLGETEYAAQVVLNRSYDLAESIFDVAGNNSEEVARVLANIYRNGFTLAAQVMNNPDHYCKTMGLAPGGWMQVATCSEARVGIAFARLAFSSSGQAISEAAKAILLVKAMGFLGWDLNVDPIRREQGIWDIVVRIADIQNQAGDSMVVNPLEIQAYQVVLKSIEDGNEPPRAAMNTLRKAVFNMITQAAQAEAQISKSLASTRHGM